MTVKEKFGESAFQKEFRVYYTISFYIQIESVMCSGGRVLEFFLSFNKKRR